MSKPTGPQIADVIAKIHRRQAGIFMRISEKMQESIRFGSTVTASPGQPVKTGDLKRSWMLTFLARWLSQSASGLEYALKIENGMGRHGKLTLRSLEGGFHSRKLTRAGMQKLTDDSVKEIVSEIP